jgi:hypothetical protein
MDDGLVGEEMNAPLDQFSWLLYNLLWVSRWEVKKKLAREVRIRLRFVSIDLANKEGVEEELIVGNHKLN